MITTSEAIRQLGIVKNMYKSAEHAIEIISMVEQGERDIANSNKILSKMGKDIVAERQLMETVKADQKAAIERGKVQLKAVDTDLSNARRKADADLTAHRADLRKKREISDANAEKTRKDTARIVAAFHAQQKEAAAEKRAVLDDLQTRIEERTKDLADLQKQFDKFRELING